MDEIRWIMNTCSRIKKWNKTSQDVDILKIGHSKYELRKTFKNNMKNNWHYTSLYGDYYHCINNNQKYLKNKQLKKNENINFITSIKTFYVNCK